jgi:MFS transporter, PPP family, 3-phenylpropionic acid transporter
VIEGFYFVSMMVVGVSAPYFPPYLQGLGFSGREISTVLSVPPLLALGVPLAWAWIADRSKQHARILRIVCAGACLGFLPLLFARRFATILPSYFGYAFFYIGIGGLTDSLAIARMQAGGDYGRMRVWGSAGCMVAAFATGLLLTWRAPGHPADPLVPYLIFAALLGALTAARRLGGMGESGAQPHLRDLRQLFARPRFRLLLIAAPLHWACCAPYNAFFGILLRDRHLPPAVLGVSFCVGVAGEMLIFVRFSRLRARLDLDTMLAIAFGASALRWLLVSQVDSIAVVMLLQLVHCFTYGLFWAAGVAVVGESAPPHLRATGQAFFVISVVGVGNILGNLAAGALYDLGGSASYAFLAAGFGELIPLALALTARRRRLRAAPA